MGLASISTKDLIAKKVYPADTFAMVLENFIVIHWHNAADVQFSLLVL